MSDIITFFSFPLNDHRKGRWKQRVYYYIEFYYNSHVHFLQVSMFVLRSIQNIINRFLYLRSVWLLQSVWSISSNSCFFFTIIEIILLDFDFVFRLETYLHSYKILYALQISCLLEKKYINYSSISIRNFW